MRANCESALPHQMCIYGRTLDMKNHCCSDSPPKYMHLNTLHSTTLTCVCKRLFVGKLEGGSVYVSLSLCLCMAPHITIKKVPNNKHIRDNHQQDELRSRHKVSDRVSIILLMHLQCTKNDDAFQRITRNVLSQSLCKYLCSRCSEMFADCANNNRPCMVGVLGVAHSQVLQFIMVR